MLQKGDCFGKLSYCPHCTQNSNMNFHLLLVLYLPVTITEIANTTNIAQFRMNFLKQMLDGIPFKLPSSRLQNQQRNRKQTNDQSDKIVKFYLYTRKYPRDSLVLGNDLSLVNPMLPVKMLVHGWTEHYYVEWCKNLTAAYLKKGLYNVIVVDYSSKGDADYISASLAVPEVGRIIGYFIANKLHRGRKVPLTRIHLISHSLGSHVAGVAGYHVIKITRRPLARISALDPAAPYFDLFTIPNEDRLTIDDATFVDIVHTDAGWLGFKTSLGNVDFYPNGGDAYQPGCSLLKPDVQYEDLFCSHARSYKFFTRSVTQKIRAVPCTSWSKFDQGACDKNNKIIFGDDVPSNTSGNYYLRTPKDIT